MQTTASTRKLVNEANVKSFTAATCFFNGAVCFSRVPSSRFEIVRLIGLFFIHGMAMGMWFVPLGTMLPAYGLEAWKPYIYGCSAVSAFISPLIFGAMADQRVAPARLLRWLSFATAGFLFLACHAIGGKWNIGWILFFCLLHALVSAPTWSISTTIVLARLKDSSRDFGPMRACGTIGWMVGCWIVSYILHADKSILSGQGAAVVWILVALTTFIVPKVAPPAEKKHRTVREVLGFDAFALFRNPNHRIVFITAALFNIPLAAFYPYTPSHLQALGFENITAVMTLAQVTEVIAMMALAWIMGRWRLKTLFLAGIGFGVARYLLSMLDHGPSLLVGITLHGFAFTLFYIVVQIYLEQRVPSAFRARAQALLTVMLGGFGNLFGYLGSGWWYKAMTNHGTTNWFVFWGGLALATAVVFVIFALNYRERPADETEGEEPKLTTN